jgi:hypothetical protein
MAVQKSHQKSVKEVSNEEVQNTKVVDLDVLHRITRDEQSQIQLFTKPKLANNQVGSS